MVILASKHDYISLDQKSLREKYFELEKVRETKNDRASQIPIEDQMEAIEYVLKHCWKETLSEQLTVKATPVTPKPVLESKPPQQARLTVEEKNRRADLLMKKMEQQAQKMEEAVI